MLLVFLTPRHSCFWVVFFTEYSAMGAFTDYGHPERKWPSLHGRNFTPKIFRYSRSIFCLPHRPNFSDIFDLCLHWVSIVRDFCYAQFNVCFLSDVKFNCNKWSIHTSTFKFGQNPKKNLQKNADLSHYIFLSKKRESCVLNKITNLLGFLTW